MLQAGESEGWSTTHSLLVCIAEQLPMVANSFITMRDSPGPRIIEACFTRFGVV